MEAEVEAWKLLFRGWKGTFETLDGVVFSSEQQHRREGEVPLQVGEGELQAVLERRLRARVVQQLGEVVSIRFEM